MISQTKQWQQRTNAPTLLAISMAMRIRWYNAKHIARDGRSRTTLDAIIRCHWASICPCITPADVIVIDFGIKNQVVAL
jgi:hypothetical protein